MKTLFVLRSPLYVFYTESVLEAILKKNHELTVLFEKERTKWLNRDYEVSLETLRKKYPHLRCGRAFWRTDKWRGVLYHTRALLSYRRFLFIQNESAHEINNYFNFLHPLVKFFFSLPFAGILFEKLAKSKLADWALRKADDVAGIDKTILAQIKEYGPDVVMICIGGMNYGSFDLDYLKAAKFLGIPTAAMAITWDSLTNKSLIQIQPDILLVWNYIHADEVVKYHSFPAKNIRLVGAPMFDRWFSKPDFSMDRTIFCRAYGLKPENPILLYLGSPPSNAADETKLITELRTALDRSQDQRLSRTQIIMRPHPRSAAFYAHLNIRGVTVLPKEPELPDNPSAFKFFYETFYHAFAAVGVNTSAFLESVIFGKPTLAILTDFYSQTQSETRKFKNMISGGAIEPVNGIDGALTVFADILDGNDRYAEQRKSFVKKMIRPYGIEISAAFKVCNEIENLVKSNQHAAKTA